MKLELLTKLKEAGFPLKVVTEENFKKELICFRGTTINSVPTLEELIEALGNNILNLERNPDRPELWRIRMYLKKGLNQNLRGQGKGSTPSEAVAELWLKLHEEA